jgi:hypothetical protein
VLRTPARGHLVVSYAASMEVARPLPARQWTRLDYSPRRAGQPVLFPRERLKPPGGHRLSLIGPAVLRWDKPVVGGQGRELTTPTNNAEVNTAANALLALSTDLLFNFAS